MSSELDQVARLHGLPHLFTNSATIIPVIVGLRELRSSSAVLFLSRGMDADSLLAKLDALKVKILNEQWIKHCVLDPYSIGGSERAVRQVLPDLRHCCPHGLVWNYTTGTKQMMLGLYSALDVGEPDSLVKDLLYVDTRMPKPIYLESVGTLPAASAMLDLDDLLHTGGYQCCSGWRFVRPLEHWQPPPDSGKGLEGWLKSLNRKTRSFIGAKPPALQTTDVVPLQVAYGLIESGFASDVRVNTKVVPLGAGGTDPAAQEFDVLLARRNTLVGIECKQTTGGGAGPQLIKIHEITKRIGGQYAVPVLIRQKLPKKPGSGQSLPTDPHAVAKAEKLGVVHLAWRWPNWKPIIEELRIEVDRLIRHP